MNSTAIEPRQGRQMPWRVIGWSALFLLLLLPAIAMQLTDEVSWDAGDFAAFGAMLLALGGAFELIFAHISHAFLRRMAMLGAVVFFFALWAFLAVGPG